MKENIGFLDAYTKDISHYQQLSQAEETELCIQIEKNEDDIWYTFAEMDPIIYKFLKIGQKFSAGAIKINDIVKTISTDDDDENAQRDMIIATFRKIVALYYEHKKMILEDDTYSERHMIEYKEKLGILARELKLNKKISISLYKEIVKVYTYLFECKKERLKLEKKHNCTMEKFLAEIDRSNMPSLEFREDKIRYEDILDLESKIYSKYNVTLDELEDAIYRIKTAFLTIDKAKRKLVESNLRLVLVLVRKYSNDIRKIPDLIQEGNIGLIIAVDKYEYQRGTKFSTYASWWIKQSVTRASLERTIHVPLYLFEIMQKVQRIKKRQSVDAMQEPSLEKIAKEMNEPIERLENALQMTSLEMTSLDTPINDSDTMTLKDCIKDETKTDIGKEFETNLLNKEIEECLTILTSRERQIIIRRYGLDGKAPETLEEIGKAFTVTRERIRQLENQALRKLRHPVYGHVLAAWFSDTFGTNFLEEKK